MKIIANNKKAFHDYSVSDKLEAGLMLVGTEVKSLRSDSASLKEAYCRIINNEVFIVNMTIPIYKYAKYQNHEPTRARKLLLHRTEITKLQKLTEVKGLTLVPLSLYFVDGKVKIEIGVGRGKKNYDKRETLKRQQLDRETARISTGKYQ